MTHAGEQAADAVAVPVPGDAPAVVFRPLTPDDTQQCKELHCILFPIEYEEDFYTKTVYGRDGIFSFGAFLDCPGGTFDGRLVGVITTRLCTEGDQDAKYVLHLGDRVGPERTVAYILTLGVHPAYRRHGLASELLKRTVAHCAALPQCQAVFLHVIEYNREAMSFYSRHAFRCTRLLRDFYYIPPGPLLPAPVKHKEKFDAFIYALYMHGGRAPPQGGLDGLLCYARSWWAARAREAAWVFHTVLAASCHGARLGPGGRRRALKGDASYPAGGASPAERDHMGDAASRPWTAAQNGEVGPSPGFSGASAPPPGAEAAHGDAGRGGWQDAGATSAAWHAESHDGRRGLSRPPGWDGRDYCYDRAGGGRGEQGQEAAARQLPPSLIPPTRLGGGL